MVMNVEMAASAEPLEPPENQSTSDTSLEIVATDKLDDHMVRSVVARLMEFESLEQLSETLTRENWTPDEEIRTLVRLAREGPTSTVQLRAIKMLRDLRLELMKNSGLLATATRTERSPDGSTIMSTQLVTSMLTQEIPNAQGYENKNKENGKNKEASGQEQEQEPSDDKEDQAGAGPATPADGAGESKSNPDIPRTVCRPPTADVLLAGVAGPQDGA